MPMHTGGSLTGESPAAFRSLSTALERLLVSLVQVAMSLSPNDAKHSRIASTCLWIVCQLSPIVRAISLIDWPSERASQMLCAKGESCDRAIARSSDMLICLGESTPYEPSTTSLGRFSLPETRSLYRSRVRRMNRSCRSITEVMAVWLDAPLAFSASSWKSIRTNMICCWTSSMS